MTLTHLVRDSLRQTTRGSFLYWAWLALLMGMIGLGAWHYVLQIRDGLVVTHMTNQVSWGLYISNFTFLVGVAAAAVMLVILAYIFDRKDIKDVVLMGDTMAIAAVTISYQAIKAAVSNPVDSLRYE